MVDVPAGTISYNVMDDRLFGEFDRSLALSRSVFGQTPSVSTMEANGFPFSNGSPGGNMLTTLGPSEHQSPASLLKGPREDHDWNEVWQKAVDRGEYDCPICMCQMEPIHLAVEENSRASSMLLRDLGDDGAPSHGKAHAAEYVPIHSNDSFEHWQRWPSLNSRDVRTIHREKISRQEGDRRKQMLGESRDGPGASMGAKCRFQRPVYAKAMLLLSCSHAFHKTVGMRGAILLHS